MLIVHAADRHGRSESEIDLRTSRLMVGPSVQSTFIDLSKKSSGSGLLGTDLWDIDCLLAAFVGW